VRHPVIGVMGPGSADAPTLENARRLGEGIARAGWVLLTGGRASGVMDVASKGAAAAGGTVVGVLPDADSSGASEGVGIAIVTGLGGARNAVNVLSSDVVVACGMGPGTASEAALAIKAERPLVLLGCGQAAERFFPTLGPRVTIAPGVEAALAAIRAAIRAALDA
jgi:uncharacterized protein (TIGR00725 family)